jgi:hypothetical protein
MRVLLASLVVLLFSCSTLYAVEDDLDEDALAAKLEKEAEKPRKKSTKPDVKKSAARESKAKEKKPGKIEKAQTDKAQTEKVQDKEKVEKAKEPEPAAKTEDAPALACPPSIDVASQKLEKKLKGWESDTDKTTHWLKTVSIYAGREKPSLYEPYRNTERSSEWALRDNGKGEVYYLVCSYHQTSVQLKRELPKHFTRCRVTPQPDPANPHGMEMLHKFECE